MAATTPAQQGEDTLSIGDIREEWWWIRPAIEELLAENPTLTYIPEDVYAEVKAERAMLFVAEGGFAVTTSKVDQFSGEKTLLMWIYWSRPRKAPALFRHMEGMRQVAEATGHTWIEARTKSERWGNALARRGWELDDLVYRKPVNVGTR